MKRASWPRWRPAAIRSRPALVAAEPGEVSWVKDVVARVEARLDAFLAAKREQARRTSPEAGELVEAVAELTMRGGKRLRPAALYAAFRAVSADGDARQTLDASAAIELLQTYFLIQDDWMDGDAVRRGGPSVHVALASQRNDTQLGASLAILAADLASGFAWELVSAAPFPEARLSEALAAFGQMHFEVVCGQQLDLLGHHDVALVHQLKTGSYTVRGPLRLGALLADASAEQLSALEAFGTPLGLAFQIRDDLLGVFGARDAVGKPVGNDLRAGKRTALVTEGRALLSPKDAEALDAVLGNPRASDEAVARATAALLGSGAREQLEARLSALLAEACGGLGRAPFHPEGVAMLSQLAENLVRRQA